MSRVTSKTEISVGSILTNYSEAFEDWDEAETKECRACYGTGLDRDEIYECPVCGGEGVVPLDFVAPRS